MAEPVDATYGPARRSGLTSSDPVRIRHGPSTATPKPAPSQNPDRPYNKRAARRPHPRFTPANSSLRNQAGN